MLCGFVSVALLIRTLVSPPDVIVGRTADNLKAFLCKTDYWDHTFTSRKYSWLFLLLITSKQIQQIIYWFSIFHFPFFRLFTSHAKTLELSSSTSSFPLFQLKFSFSHGVYACVSWWGKLLRNLTRVASYRWQFTMNSFSHVSSMFPCKYHVYMNFRILGLKHKSSSAKYVHE